MDAEHILIEALRASDPRATVERDGALTRVDGRFDLARVAEAFAAALHRRDEALVVDVQPDTAAIAAEMHALLAPVR